MNILITGGTGFIGGYLLPKLLEHQHTIYVLTRQQALCAHNTNNKTYITDLAALQPITIDAVINLAGAGLFDKRWTAAYKQVIVDSRVTFTQKLVEFFSNKSQYPKIWVNGSAIGYYGDQKEATVTETTPPIDEWTHQLCQQWETAALGMESFGTRVCLLRLGIVLESNGGALRNLLLPFKLGLGGIMGSGQQWMSWIHMQDVVQIIQYCLTSAVTGPVNVTAPCPARNVEFTKALGKAVHRPAMIPMPEFVVKLLIGEASHVLLTGQKVLPDKLQQMGYTFAFESLSMALETICQN